MAVSAYLGLAAVNDTEDTAQRERLTSTARTAADHVDDVLTRTVGREEHLARMVANAQGQGDQELAALLDSYPRLLFESELYLLRPPAELVWSMTPGAPGPGALFAEPLVRESLESRQSALGTCAGAPTQARPRACLASPVPRGDGDRAAVLPSR